MAPHKFLEARARFRGIIRSATALGPCIATGVAAASGTTYYLAHFWPTPAAATIGVLVGVFIASGGRKIGGSIH